MYLAAVSWLLWWVVVAAAVPSWTAAVITSGSMAPVIRPGDLVVVAEVPPSDLEAGAVLTFREVDRGLLTHRIVEELADGTYRTRGDANPTDDPGTVAPDDVVGRGRLLIPALGRPVVWAQQGRWHLLLAWLATTAGAIHLVAGWWPRGSVSATGRAWSAASVPIGRVDP